MTEIALRRSEFGHLPFLATPEGPAVTDRPTTAIAFSIVDNPGDFEALAAEWNDLFARSGRPEHVFQSFAWNWHWSRHYLSASRQRLAIVTGRNAAGCLVLLMPFVVERRAGLKQLAWMGDPVSQYNDLLADPEARDGETLAAAWRFVVGATRADVAALRKVRADAWAAPLLARIGARVTATEEAPFVNFGQASDYAVFEQTIPAKGRKNRRRHARRLAERGSITFELHAGTEEAGHLAAYAISLKRAWLKSRDTISLALADDRFMRFFRDVAVGGDHKVDCRVLALRSCNEVAALQIVLGNGNARFLHVAVYGLKFEKLGVGGLLLERTMADGCRDGIGRLDLLAPRHEYKMEFAGETALVHDHAVALSILGRAYTNGFLGIRRRLKAGVEQLPAPARRLLAAAVSVRRRHGA